MQPILRDLHMRKKGNQGLVDATVERGNGRDNSAPVVELFRVTGTPSF
jgi:hypothetical protein